MQGLVTVFGATGFLGRYVVRALAREGWRIRVAARRPAGAPELMVMGEVGQIDLAVCDVRDPVQAARALEGCNAAVNLVGVLYERGRQNFQALHADTPASLGRLAVAAGVTRFVQMSALGADAASDAAYARTKAAGETGLTAVFPRATILRPSIVFGPEDAFFNRFAAMAAFSPAIPLIGGGRTRFQPVYVADVAAAVAAALRLEAGGVFELGGPSIYSFRALMEAMLRQINRRRVLVPVPFGIASLMGEGAETLARLGLAPPITRDQVALLRTDNVTTPGAPGLAELGVAATALEAVLPTYLWRYRDGGQFAEPAGRDAASQPREIVR